MDSDYKHKYAFIPKQPGQPTTKSLRGLGDVVYMITKFLGITMSKGCGCSNRQAWLNKYFPFKFKP